MPTPRPARVAPLIESLEGRLCLSGGTIGAAAAPVRRHHHRHHHHHRHAVVQTSFLNLASPAPSSLFAPGAFNINTASALGTGVTGFSTLVIQPGRTSIF